jgi:hypothetical protein
MSCKKNCLGKNEYFLKGTENMVICSYRVAPKINYPTLPVFREIPNQPQKKEKNKP